MINKAHVILLFLIILLTTAVVLVLNSIRPSIDVDVNVKCGQIKFSLIHPDGNDRAVSILNSGLWLKHATIDRFNRIIFKGDPSIQESALAGYGDSRDFIIVPGTPDSYVEMASQEDAFSLSNIIVESDIALKWSVENNYQHLVLQKTGAEDSNKIVVGFSTGDSLKLRLYNCLFVDHKGQILFETEKNGEFHLNIPISFIRQEVHVFADKNSLEFSLDIQAELYSENIDLLKELPFKDIDYDKEERLPTLQSKRTNTILEGTIKRPKYSLGDLVEIRKGDYINPVPANGTLNSLRVGPKSLAVSLRYHVQSMRIGPYADAEHELVKSKLDLWSSNPTLVVIYTVSMGLFYFIINFILRKKKAKT